MFLLIAILTTIGNLTTLTGSFVNENLGSKALCMGDVNGDGYDDLIYTATRFATSYPAVWILFGGVNFDSTPDVVLTYNPPYYGCFGYAIWTCDVNRDGCDDVIVSNPVEFGIVEEKRLTEFPSTTRAGREVFIYYGAPNIGGIVYPSITIPAPVGDPYEFGLDICTVNFGFNINPPDEWPDIVVGCPNKVGAPDCPKVFVFKGPDFVQYHDINEGYYFLPGSRLGYSVTAADYNRDGVDEIVAGAYAYNGQQGAFIVWNAWGNWMHTFDQPPVRPGARFGFDVSSGDVTNDGYPDLIISAYRDYPPKVFVSYGYPYWGYVPISLNQTLHGLHSNYDFFGICVAHCGDVNKDGIGDIAVGACQNGYIGVGNGYMAIYFGGNDSIDRSPDFVIYGEAYDDGLGYELSVKPGDMNGNGSADVAVSAPYNDAGGRNAGRIYVYGELALLSSDFLALAYNGNRHLARKPNSNGLHLVYTHSGKVLYTKSTDEGATWDYTPFEVGCGRYPAITLSSTGLPSIAWTDDGGGLWYRRQTAPDNWGEIYHLYDPWPIWFAKLNAPPSIVITTHSTGDSVHILCTMHIPANGPINRVAVYSFHINAPMNGSFAEIEGGVGQNAGAIRSNPSITRCALDNSLHAVWQRGDTICYAIREVGQTWDNWGWQFQERGLQSAHPFVECYGDMVYVVWQHQATPGAPEEVYKGWRQLSQPTFANWTNLSRTPDSPSRYPVNASGLFTVFMDSPTPPINGPEIYYKVDPDDPLYNISGTIASSNYPQSVARITGSRTYLYTAWLDGDGPAYEIRLKKLEYIPIRALAYLTSNNGYEIPSPYLVARDSFIPDWQIPVDIGYQTITYRFPLEPNYRYKIRLVAYHESSGQWRELVKIDNKLKHQIKYNAYEPETLEFWIPPAFYKDGVIEVVFDKISGSFATAGPIYIYQYEYEDYEEVASGPMAQASYPLNNKETLNIFPNPFVAKTDISYQEQSNSNLSLKIYDITGRVVKHLYDGMIEHNLSVIWSGDDEIGRIVPAGIYFLRVENSASNKTLCRKIIKVE